MRRTPETKEKKVARLAKEVQGEGAGGAVALTRDATPTSCLLLSAVVALDRGLATTGRGRALGTPTARQPCALTELFYVRDERALPELVYVRDERALPELVKAR